MTAGDNQLASAWRGRDGGKFMSGSHGTRHATCFSVNMTLPYPPEVEGGTLPTRAPVVREPFDVERHLHEAIRGSGSGLELFGVQCTAVEPETAAALVNRFRDILSAHFQERFSNADATTWSSFESQARSQVERSPNIDDSTLRALLMTIDGL
jgi:hypothetical protein